MGSEEKFSLEWNDFQKNMVQSVGILRNDSEFCDVTLVGDDHKRFNAHKVLLSTSSTYFKQMLKATPNQLMVCLNDVKSDDIENVLDFIYTGEVKIPQENLDRFLEVSQRFQLLGLTELDSTGNESENFQEFNSKIDDLKDNAKALTSSDEKFGQTHDNTKALISNENDLQSSKTHHKNMKVQIGPYDDINELDGIIDSMIERNNMGMLLCTVCPHSAKARGHMREHVETHIEGLSFNCNFCDKIVKTRHVLRDHVRKVHK